MSMKMTMAEFVGLEPCPFCGGKARPFELTWHAGQFGAHMFEKPYWQVICGECKAAIGDFNSKAEAIAAWNSRVDYHGYEQAAIEAWESIKAWNSRAERTCKPLGTIRYDYEGGYAGFEYETELSCGHKWRDAYGDYPDYCPSCGCKVVSE